MTKKATEMKLEVDLQCPCCYKKVKKILCKFPQIRDQVYDEKNNIVKITVVCCSPEKIRDKLCCKGGKVIKSIKIVPPPPPPPPPQTPLPPPRYEGHPGGPCYCGPWPWPYYEGHPGGLCYCGPWPCYEGHPGGACYCGNGRPVPPPPCCDNCDCQYCYGYNWPCYMSSCDYFGEENPSACAIM